MDFYDLSKKEALELNREFIKEGGMGLHLYKIVAFTEIMSLFFAIFSIIVMVCLLILGSISESNNLFNENSSIMFLGFVSCIVPVSLGVYALVNFKYTSLLNEFYLSKHKKK